MASEIHLLCTYVLQSTHSLVSFIWTEAWALPVTSCQLGSWCHILKQSALNKHSWSHASAGVIYQVLVLKFALKISSCRDYITSGYLLLHYKCRLWMWTYNHKHRFWMLTYRDASDASVHQLTGLSLVQIMACHLYGTKPLSEPMMTLCQLNS